MNGIAEGLRHVNEMMQGLDELFILIVQVLTYFFTAIGIWVLTITFMKAFAGYWKRYSSDHLQLMMAKGMQLSLQFLLGGEILRTVITENLDGILIVGAIIVLRIVLTVTIHWESNGLSHPHPVLKAKIQARKNKLKKEVSNGQI